MFVCEDILEHIKKRRQEAFDYIIGIASFQHIPSKKERFYLMKSFYRLLRYDGKLMISNRSFSSRFLQKYQKNILSSLRRYILSRGKKDWKDILIPRKSAGHTFHRFYHIFTLKELKSLATLSGFLIDTLQYVEGRGKETNNRKEAKNTVLIAEKRVFTD